MKEVIKNISYVENGKFPKKELEEIIANKEEAIPELLQVVDQFIDDPSIASDNHDYFGHLYAFFLLGQFKEQTLFPKLLQLLHWSEQELDRTIGDFLTEGSGRILASVYNGDLDALKELVENVDCDEYARGQAICAITILMLYEQLDREDIISYYQKLLKDEKMTPYLFAELIMSACDLHLDELFEDIQWAYEKGLVDTWVVNLDGVKNDMTLDKEIKLESSKSNPHKKYIDDTIEELQWWHIFNQKKTKSPRIPKKILKFPLKINQLFKSLKLVVMNRVFVVVEKSIKSVAEFLNNLTFA